MSRLVDLLFLILAITTIYYRYQLIKLPVPKSDIPFVISDQVTDLPRTFGDLQYFKLGQVQVVTRTPPVYQYGDHLTAKGTLTPKMEMRYPRITEFANLLVSQSNNNGKFDWWLKIQKNLLNLRETLTQQISDNLPSPEAELISGVLWGEKASLPKDFNDALKRTGTIHMVVVSGYNISVVAAILLTLFSIFGRRLGGFLTILGIVVFTLLTGAQSATIRAAVMGSLAVIGKINGREKTALRLLLISAILILIVNPLLVEDLGFQLSFLATLGILLFGGGSPVTITKKDVATPGSFCLELGSGSGITVLRDVLRALWPELRTTLAAQVLVWPILATAFGQVSLISPAANIAVAWLIPYLMAGGALLTAVSPLSSLLARLVSLILLVPATFFVTVVTELSKIPEAVVNFNIGKEFLIGYYLIIGLVVVTKLRHRDSNIRQS